MDGEYRKLMDNFRLSIRRKKIDQLFQTQRAQLLKHQTENQKQQLKYLLQNTQSRQNWLHNTALKLTGFPNIQWASLLNNLYYALPLFEDHYEEWEKLGIIKAICDSLAPQYLQLNLTRVVANILTDIFYMSLKSQNQRLAKSILEYKFIDRIMQIMMLSPSNQYIRLVGIFCEVAPNMRNYLISQQLLSFILKRVKQLHENENKINQSFHSILYLVYSLLKSHQFDLKTFSRPKKTTISALLPLLCSELQSNHTAQNFCLILKSLKQICVIGKEQVFQQLIRYPTIFDKALQLFCFENRHEIRYQSAKFICNFLLSSNPEHTKILANKNILHRVYESYRLVDNRDENRLMLLSLLSNFTADYRQFQQMFVMHPLLQEIVIPEAGYSHNDNLRRQAVYCICNILRAGEQDELCFKIMTQLNITDILVLNLNRSQPDVETVKQILSTWRQVMANSSQTSKESLTYRIVKNGYDIGGILENLSDIDDLESHVLEFSCFFTQLQMD